MSFQVRHWNRLELPTKHVLVCEDNLDNQVHITSHLRKLFMPEGRVQFSFVPGAMMAAGVIGWCQVDLILLDHDMPNGNGADLMKWLQTTGRSSIPVITFSGIPENNTIMASLGPVHLFSKGEVWEGKADSLIHQILGA